MPSSKLKANATILKRILFVCTGNIFRSAVAEYCLQHHIPEGSNIVAESAGIEAKHQTMFAPVRNQLASHGINASNHRQRRVTATILEKSSLVIAMGLDHRSLLKNRFGCDATLFYEVVTGEERPVLDINEAIHDWKTNTERVVEYSVSIVDFIHESMPEFLKNVREILHKLD